MGDGDDDDARRADANANADATTTREDDARGADVHADASERASVDARASDANESDEDEECGFCKYMKGGSCRDAFVAWEACVDAAKARGEDFVDACFETTSALRDCMLLDPEYYGPMTGGDDEVGEGGDVEGEAVETREGAKESAA